MKHAFHPELKQQLLYTGSHIDISLQEGYGGQPPVIIKLQNTSSPQPHLAVSLNTEYEICRQLDLPGVRKVLGKIRHGTAIGLVLEYIDGITLKELCNKGPLPLSAALEIGVQLSETLGSIHQHGIIHLDLTSSNILYSQDSRTATIIDFGKGSRLSLRPETQQPGSSTSMAYIAPEQSGRLNMLIDHRADLYSLGIVLYELLTGRPPFTAEDPLELIHCHIAKKAVPADALHSAVPPIVAAIVAKLLEKNPGHRYQSGFGLKADLARCLTHLRRDRDIPEFPLALQDRQDKLRIPSKLYGREQEVDKLLAAYTRAASGRGPELVMVSGYSGIGKSSLVNEIRGAIVELHGQFIKGKFDQLLRNIPYSGVMAAFGTIIDQLLGGQDEVLTSWKTRILQAVGDNGQVLIDVLPEIALILGPQPAVPRLGPTESQNRFNRVFVQFLEVLCRPEQPLVIFLDDMQWADLASLKLIELLASSPDLRHLLVIGAFRDNEVSPHHPLTQTLDRITRAGPRVVDIVLGPLQRQHIVSLLADALNQPEKNVDPLATLVRDKTGGNPFFVDEFLGVLTGRRLLFFLPPQGEESGRWDWDTEAIRRLEVTSNVVDLLLDRISELSQEEQRTLALAACLGNEFSLSDLAMVTTTSEVAAYRLLQPGLTTALLYPLSGPRMSSTDFSSAQLLHHTFRFRHDRIQQAAYSLIGDSERARVHLDIGRHLHRAGREKDGVDFSVVDHFNIGHGAIDTSAERLQVAGLNLAAGQKAKEALAYDPALRYFRSGLALMPDNGWHDHYPLMLEMSLERLEAEFLNSNFQQARDLSREILEHTMALLDAIKVYEILILFHITQNEMNEAIATGLTAMELLGMAFPADEVATRQQVAELHRQLPATTGAITALADLPEMTDQQALAAVRILSRTSSAAYIADPVVWPLIILKTVQLCVEHGNSPLAAPAYSWYGALLCGPFLDIGAGYQYGRLALKVLDRFNAPELIPKVNNMFNVFVRVWKEHVGDAAASLDDAIRTGLDMGDVEYAFYAAAHQGNYKLMAGEELGHIHSLMHSYLGLTIKHQFEFHENFIRIFLQTVDNLSGNSTDPTLLKGDFFDEDLVLPGLIQRKIVFLVLCGYGAKAMLAYLFGRHRQALEAARTADMYNAGAAGTLYYSEHNLYYSLALLATASPGKVPIEVSRNQEKMKLWAEHAPVNFQYRHDLVEAEKSRVQGNIGEAIRLFDTALLGAEEAGNSGLVGLINEVYARFWLSIGKQEVARIYFTRGYRMYRQWGARAKVVQLEMEQPWLLGNTASLTGSRSLAGAFDLASIIKMSQAISREIDLTRLCTALLKLVIENAGAEEGTILLERSNGLLVQATGSVGMTPTMVPMLPLSEADFLCQEIVHYVSRTGKTVLIQDATQPHGLLNAEYIHRRQPQSILCLPMSHQETLRGILYLENRQTTGAFQEERMAILEMLSSQMAIALDNALLYEQVTQQTAALQEVNNRLGESEENLRITLDAIGDAVIATDGEGRVTRMNPMAETLTGYPLATAKGKPLEEIFSLVQEGSRTPLPSPAREVLASGQATELQQGTLLLTSDGQERYVADSGAPIRDRTGKIVGMVLVFRDITHELQISNQLRQAEKMQAIGQLAGGVAHDFNNMLAGIIGATELLQLTTGDQPQAEKFIAMIKNATERASGLTRRLLAFSRKGKQVSTPVDIHAIVADAVAIVERSIDRRITISQDLAAREHLVVGDPSQLQNGILNLCVNARDAMPEGGTLTITSCNIALDAAYCSAIGHLQPGSYIQLSIQDTGCGIAPEHRDRIFEPFFTTKEVGKGTGLGLSAVYGMMQEHHGDIRLYSEPGQGTVFHLYLPVADSDMRPMSEEDEPEHLGSGTILVVDDEEIIRTTAAMLLEDIGYTVLLAADGRDGVELYREKHAEIDLVILDMVMPVLDGRDAFYEIKAINPQARVIMSSGFTRHHNLGDLTGEGLDGYIMKPFQRRQLRKLIADVLHR